MKRSLTITPDPINEAKLVATREASNEMGAANYFSGIVRAQEGESTIAAIDYETYQEMAEHQFNLIFDQIEKKWPVESIRLVHRIGVVKAQEASLWVEIIAPHRGEAFEACQWLIDQMKLKVPIWKKPIETRNEHG